MTHGTPQYMELDPFRYLTILGRVGEERLICYSANCLHVKPDMTPEEAEAARRIQPNDRIYHKYRGKARLSTYYHDDCWDALLL